MKTIVARVVRVRMGHSPTAMVQAVDEFGHEQKLEIPVEHTRDIKPGGVLVLQWTVHAVPEMPREGVVEIDVLPAPEPAPPEAPRGLTSPADEVGQLEAMLGLRPGRLRGVG